VLSETVSIVDQPAHNFRIGPLSTLLWLTFSPSHSGRLQRLQHKEVWKEWVSTISFVHLLMKHFNLPLEWYFGWSPSFLQAPVPSARAWCALVCMTPFAHITLVTIWQTGVLQVETSQVSDENVMVSGKRVCCSSSCQGYQHSFHLNDFGAKELEI